MSLAQKTQFNFFFFFGRALLLFHSLQQPNWAVLVSGGENKIFYFQLLDAKCRRKPPGRSLSADVTDNTQGFNHNNRKRVSGGKKMETARETWRCGGVEECRCGGVEVCRRGVVAVDVCRAAQNRRARSHTCLVALLSLWAKPCFPPPPLTLTP